MTNSSRKRSANPGARKGHVRPTQEKRDDDIMGTNDSSIVSKRSVSKLYFPDEPDFYQPFVQKFARRNPLINRGYWLRMHAIEQVVLRFLNESNQVPKIIVNLGCGYDPLPFQFWHRHSSSSQNATFVDVDYPQLIERKRDRMLKDDLLRDALLKTNLRSASSPVYLRSDKYAAIGCDLRHLDTLRKLLDAEFDLSASSILFVAEVSVTYMPLVDANTLIGWASKFDNARFCLLEQYLPQGPNHPFAKTMLKHFNKLQTPIYAVDKYPTLNDQRSRFTSSGWSVDFIRNLWDLWSDNAFTPSDLRRRLDAVEPFDEWEEFALFGGHYFLLVASNSKAAELQETCGKLDAQEPSQSTPNHRIVVTSQEASPGFLSMPRRFGAAFEHFPNAIGHYGGQGAQHRLTSIDILERNGAKSVLLPPPIAQARICHTITNINGNNTLLVGGRTSPSHVFSDCWSLNNGLWQEVEQLHPGRFRHSSVRASLPHPGSEVAGVLVFGGKTSDGSVLDDCNFWTPNHGWQQLPVSANRPPPRFGAAICSLETDDRGVLLGGMSSDGTVLDDIWEYVISADPEPLISFRERTRDLCANPAKSKYARFGASLVPFGDALLLIGGAASKGILGLSDEFAVISPRAKIHLETPKLTLPKDTWPLLVGAGVTAASEGEVLILGGGAVCFSMGSFWNECHTTVKIAGAADSALWTVSTINAVEQGESHVKSSPKHASKAKGKQKLGSAKRKEALVPRIQVKSADDFSELLAASKPEIIENLNLGPCTELWTLDYLKDKLGADREIVIHECSSNRMTFKDKNFQYVKQSVGDFLDGISNGSQTYLRAVSASQPNKLPTKLEEDFPAIAADFHLPAELSSIKAAYHSSPLRISGPVSLWLHYDVLANVLCQIKGTKMLHLYPPADVKYLDYPPGGSSSNTNVLASQDPRLRHTHPHIASLRPGDVLFIPPMWSHTATPEDGYSVAVNVFFKNLDKGYAAGKDVYGNRDLQAYENGRRDVDKIVRAFKDVPKDISRFYLDRLVAELQDKADAICKDVHRK